MRFFAKKYIPVAGFCIFSSGSTFPGGIFAFFRQEALSCGRILLFFVRKHFPQRDFCFFSPGSTFPGGISAFSRQEALSPTGKVADMKKARTFRNGLFLINHQY